MMKWVLPPEALYQLSGNMEKGYTSMLLRSKGQNQVITINATEESHQTPSAPNITSFSPATSLVKNTVGEKGHLASQPIRLQILYGLSIMHWFRPITA